MSVQSQRKNARPDSPGRAPLQNTKWSRSLQITIFIPNSFFLGRQSRHSKYRKALNSAELRDVPNCKVNADHWPSAFPHCLLIVKDITGLADSRNRASASHIDKGKSILAIGSWGSHWLTAVIFFSPSRLLKGSVFAIKIVFNRLKRIAFSSSFYCDKGKLKIYSSCMGQKKIFLI